MATGKKKLVASGGLILATALLAAPTPAEAQAVPQQAEAIETARVLEREARRLARNSETYQEAGDLYRTAAALRGEADPTSVQDLKWAGRLAFYRGEHGRAADDFERAAELALELDDTAEVVDSYYQAAWVAWSAENRVRAARLLHGLRRLARDPDFVRRSSPEVIARIVELHLNRG